MRSLHRYRWMRDTAPRGRDRPYGHTSRGASHVPNIDAMGIRHKLSLPSTFILKKDGTLAFKYIGRDPKDRPATKLLLDELGKL